MTRLREDRIGTFLARNAIACPSAPAVSDGNGTMTWEALAGRVDGFSAQLAELGVSSGTRVALWLPNGADYLIAIFAVARRGAIAVHVNTRFGPSEVGDLLDRTKTSVLVTRSGFGPVDFLGLLGTIGQERLTGLRTVICFGPAPADIGGIPVKPPTFAGVGEDISTADDACLIFTTGGTTARPKLVVHTQRSIAGHASAVMRRLGTDQPDAALLAAVPFCGTFGNVAAVAAVAGGAHIVCMDVFDPNSADAAIRAHRITHLIGDDRMLGRLATVALEGDGPHDGIRFFGVAAFNPDAAESCRRGVAAGFGPSAIYGSSEAQALFAIGNPELGGWGAVQLTDPEASIAVTGAEQSSGELIIRAPSLFAYYLDDPAATSAARSVENWFRSGDLAEHAGSSFTFHGRMGDVLRLGGFLVNPLEIENFLQQQAGVSGAQVVGVRSGRDFSAFAFITTDGGVTLDEAALLATCRNSLARYKVPIRAVSVSEFPTSTGPNGPKISRAELRRLADGIVDGKQV